MGETNQSRTARRNFGRLGWALLVVLGVLSAVTFLLMLCIAVAAMDPSRDIRFLLVYDFPYWVLCRLPLYALGIPAAMLILKGVPKSTPESRRFPLGRVLYFALLANAMQVVLSMAVSIPVNLLAKTPAQAAPEPVTFWYLLDIVLLSPVLEELLFRKMLLDRFRRYGEKLAILVSAVVFAVSHMDLRLVVVNLALGAVLAYVYLRSGRVRYCMLIHSLSNFCAAGMMQLFLNRLSPKAFMAMQMEDLGMFTPDVLLELLPLAVYTLIYYILVVVGLVLLIRNRKKAVFEPAEQPLTKNQAVHALFGSAGMTLFIGVSLLMLLNSLSAPFVQ